MPQVQPKKEQKNIKKKKKKEEGNPDPWTTQMNCQAINEGNQTQKDKHCVIHLHEGLGPRPGNFHMPRVQPKKIVSHKVIYKWNENENTT